MVKAANARSLRRTNPALKEKSKSFLHCSNITLAASTNLSVKSKIDIQQSKLSRALLQQLTVIGRSSGEKKNGEMAR